VSVKVYTCVMTMCNYYVMRTPYAVGVYKQWTLLCQRN